MWDYGVCWGLWVGGPLKRGSGQSGISGPLRSKHGLKDRDLIGCECPSGVIDTPFQCVTDGSAIRSIADSANGQMRVVGTLFWGKAQVGKFRFAALLALQ